MIDRSCNKPQYGAIQYNTQAFFGGGVFVLWMTDRLKKVLVAANP
jgi:hypothetical protein